MTDPSVNSPTDARAAAVLARCDELAGCSDEAGRITRLFLGAGMRAAHARVDAWMRRAGLAVRIDAAGNLIGRRAAKHADAPVLLLASHLDTVPHGGRYDGTLGVLVALACVEALGDAALPFHIDVIAFSEEEGVRFGLPYLGSRAVAGTFDPAALNRIDAQGITLREAIHAFGLDPRKINECAYPRDRMLGYIEVHLEQGSVLEAENVPVGVVSVIAGQSRLKLNFTGNAGHAGTTPMNSRADALVAAAKMIVAAHHYGQTVPDLRVTAGAIRNTPNIANVIPAATQVSLDVRHARDAVRLQAIDDITQEAHRQSAAAHVRFEIEENRADPAVTMDPQLTAALTRVVQELGHPVRTMVSGAGHDAVPISALCGVAMLFVRHPGGISHHPDERVERGDVGVAIDVLTRAVRNLAQNDLA